MEERVGSEGMSELTVGDVGEVSKWYPFLFHRPDAGRSEEQGQRAFHSSPKRRRAIIAANRSGKTESGCVEAAMFATGVHPWQEIEVPNRGWYSSLDMKVARNVILPKLRRHLGASIQKFYKQDNLILLRNGSEIVLKSEEQGREKYQGDSIRWLALDEEHGEEVYGEARMRLLDQAGHEWMTLTPLKGFGWVYDVIWHNCEGDPEIVVFNWGTKHNPHLPAGEVEKLRRSLTSEWERRIRIDGEFLDIAGMPVFDPDVVREMAERTVKAPMEGRLEWDGEEVRFAA